MIFTILLVSLNKIKINDKIFGDNQSCYTIAEAGANHEGDIEKAFKLIDGAKEAKADSIKFQTYKAEKLCTRNAPKYWDDGVQNETQFDVFSKLDSLSESEWKEIFEYSLKKNITCFSTPFDEESVDFLYSLNVPAFKIASADITHIPLIKSVARKHLLIFISTGMASDDEIKDAVNSIEDEGNQEIIIMHCITSYPTDPKDANLQMIKKLKTNFPNYVIGYSDHTIGIVIPTFSTFYGAKVIEKHFTYDKNLSTSRDHRLSLDINEFSNLVNNLRLSEITIGNGENLLNCEEEAVKYARRSIVSTQKIAKGMIITKNMLDIKRPGLGIYPKFLDQVIGSIAKNDILEDLPIQFNDIIQK